MCCLYGSVDSNVKCKLSWDNNIPFFKNNNEKPNRTRSWKNMPRAFYFRSDHISTAHIIIFHSHENVKPTKLRNISTLAFLCKPQSFFFSFVLLLLFEIAHEKYYIHKLYPMLTEKVGKWDREADQNVFKRGEGKVKG